MNGSQSSPQQMLQQPKTLLAQNGIKSNPNGAGSSKMLLPNGRQNTELNTEKQQDSNEIETQYPVFAKPFKIPSIYEQCNQKLRSTKSDHSTARTEGGRDVESILKLMTSTLEPLTKIAATPRTEIEVHQPNKSHIYANLPPFLRFTRNNGNYFKF